MPCSGQSDTDSSKTPSHLGPGLGDSVLGTLHDAVLLVDGADAGVLDDLLRPLVEVGRRLLQGLGQALRDEAGLDEREQPQHERPGQCLFGPGSAVGF